MGRAHQTAFVIAVRKLSSVSYSSRVDFMPGAGIREFRLHDGSGQIARKRERYEDAQDEECCRIDDGGDSKLF